MDFLRDALRTLEKGIASQYNSFRAVNGGPMQIDISRIRKTGSAPQSQTVRGSVEPPEMVPPVAFTGPADAEILLENCQGRLHLSAQVSVRVTWTCTRCLEPYQTDETLHLREVLSPAGSPDTGMGPCFTYRGDQLVLDEFIGQALILSAGTGSVCSRACRGLCPVCGGNRNRIPCDCREETIDPRMEILETLRRED